MQLRRIHAGLVAGPLGMMALLACTTFSTDDPPPATGEGGAEASAPPDAGPETASVGSRFCDVRRDAALCSDFDGIGDPLAGWAKVEGPGGELTTDLTTFVSPPRSLRARVSGSGSATLARLSFAVPKQSTRMHLSFDARLTEPIMDVGRDLAVAEILCANVTAAQYDGAWLHWRRLDSGMQLGIVTSTNLTQLVGIPTRQWIRLELDARWDAMPRVIVRLDGVEIATIPLTTACALAESASVNIGANVNDGTFVGETSFDNVVVDYEP